jgi:hypothetical protein
LSKSWMRTAVVNAVDVSILNTSCHTQPSPDEEGQVRRNAYTMAPTRVATIMRTQLQERRGGRGTGDGGRGRTCPMCVKPPRK